ncbi:hypothetical protein L9F63_015288, partial [Diploptera punctata]
ALNEQISKGTIRTNQTAVRELYRIIMHNKETKLENEFDEFEIHIKENEWLMNILTCRNANLAKYVNSKFSNCIPTNYAFKIIYLETTILLETSICKFMAVLSFLGFNLSIYSIIILCTWILALVVSISSITAVKINYHITCDCAENCRYVFICAAIFIGILPLIIISISYAYIVYSLKQTVYIFCSAPVVICSMANPIALCCSNARSKGEINESNFICIVLDEATDISNISQLSPVFRTIEALYKIVVQLIHYFRCEKYYSNPFDFNFILNTFANIFLIKRTTFVREKFRRDNSLFFDNSILFTKIQLCNICIYIYIYIYIYKVIKLLDGIKLKREYYARELPPLLGDRVR